MEPKVEEAIGTPLRQLWTIDEVAEFLNVPKSTLYKWRYKGYGPPAWRIGKQLRYDAAAVRRWLIEEAA